MSKLTVEKCVELLERSELSEKDINKSLCFYTMEGEPVIFGGVKPPVMVFETKEQFKEFEDLFPEVIKKYTE